MSGYKECSLPSDFRFVVHEPVRIRWGRRRGQVGRVIQRQPARIYQVRFPDGEVLFYAEESFTRFREDSARRVPHVVGPTAGATPSPSPS